MTHDSQDLLFNYSTIKLAELSVCNWGSFHGLHTATIDPHGTLITGDNGAGKSTFIDALMALLLPAGKAAFNVAASQGDRSDRSLLSYMRGSFGSDHDGLATRIKSKREKAVITGLRALYRAEDGTEVTLLALFWIAHAGNALSDVRRLYLVARRNLSLKEVLNHFSDGNVRELKQSLRSLEDVYDCDERFNDYQELYRKQLHMENPNAPALLSRALGLKKIDDLTRLIRELVLEPADIRADARQMVEEFADLESIYNRLIDARAQVEHLYELPVIDQQINHYAAQAQDLLQQRHGVATYFAECFAVLWQQRLQQLDNQHQALVNQIATQQQKQQDAESLEKRRYREFYDCGGARIEELKKEIKRLQETLARMVQTASRYQHDCRQLNLPEQLEEHLFASHQQQATAALASIAETIAQQQDRFGAAAGELSNIQVAIQQTESEIRTIAARPNSNIPAKQQQWRDELCQALDIAPNRLLFIGEMLEVLPKHQVWQGAIERALGGLRTTLLVPQDDYPQITRWLNSRHMGVHIRVQVAKEHSEPSPAFRSDGLLTKLTWRDHPYQNWLQKHLSKYDLTAVESTEVLDKTPFSITREGLQHLEHGRFEKKDQTRIDDKRHWHLGFSNRLRLNSLQEELATLKTRAAEQQKNVSAEREALNHTGSQKQWWENLQHYHWPDINVPYGQNALQQHQQDLQQLEATGGDLQTAKARWEEACQTLKSIQDQLNTLGRQQGGLETDRQNTHRQLEQIQPLLQQPLAQSVRDQLRQRIGEVLLDQANRQHEAEKKLDTEIQQTEQRQKTMEIRAANIIGSFKGKEKWQPLTAEWGIGLNGLEDGIRHLHKLEQEGLPALVEQFQNRLNKHTTQSLIRLQNRLDNEHDDIRERIGKINQVLAKTEFRQGSYLKLSGRREKFFHVQAFDEKVKTVLNSSIRNENPENRFLLLKEVIDTLDKASSRDSSTTLGTVDN